MSASKNASPRSAPISDVKTDTMHSPFSNETVPPPVQERRKARKAVAVYLSIVFVACSFLWGYRLGAERGAGQTGSASATIEVLNSGENRATEQLDFAQFWDIWQMIRERYARQPVDEKAMYNGAIAGMVASLGDPHSIYFEPKAAEEFNQELSGRFEGIGAEIGMKKNVLLLAEEIWRLRPELRKAYARSFVLLWAHTMHEVRMMQQSE